MDWYVSDGILHTVCNENDSSDPQKQEVVRQNEITEKLLKAKGHLRNLLFCGLQ